MLCCTAALLQVVDKSRYAAGDNSLEREIQVLCKVGSSSSSGGSNGIGNSSEGRVSAVAVLAQLLKEQGSRAFEEPGVLQGEQQY